MATAEGYGLGEGLAEPGLDGMVYGGGEVPESPLSFSASMAVEAALAQDEIEDANRRAAKEAAAIRHFLKDPRDTLL
jgi:hypothetical protein